MRISDWSSDVCSSDLIDSRHPLAARALRSGLGTAQQAQHFRAQRIAAEDQPLAREREVVLGIGPRPCERADRSEEHTSELQSLMRNSYAVFCLKKKKKITTHIPIPNHTHHPST